MLENLIKVNQVSPLKYDKRIGIMSASGMGKTFTTYHVLSDWCGDDYIIFDTGMEGGLTALENARYIETQSWSDYIDSINQVIIAKVMGQMDIKMVAIDTVDELQRMAETHIIDKYNSENPGKPVKSINDGALGFGVGLNQAANKILDTLQRLENAGIGMWLVFHSKMREREDEISNETYKELTSDLGSSTFNKYLTKLDILGTIYTSREIEQKTKINFVGKTEKEGKLKAESRIMTFRDESSAIRSKSRFADIIDSIELDPKEFDKAVTDAIQKATKLDDDKFKKRVAEFEKKREEEFGSEKFDDLIRVDKIRYIKSFEKFLREIGQDDMFDETMKRLQAKYKLEKVNDLWDNKEVPLDELYNSLKKLAERLGTDYELVSFLEA